MDTLQQIEKQIKLRSDTVATASRKLRVLRDQLENAEMALRRYRNQERKKDLVVMFWKLSVSNRRKIMTGLGLVGSEDEHISEPERYKSAFQRAHERGQESELATRIEKCFMQE